METTNIKFRCHLTENHQLQAADALIKKLKLELGAANAYIQELEEGREAKYRELKVQMAEVEAKLINVKDTNKKLLMLTDSYKKAVDKVTSKYSDDLSVLKEEPVIAALTSKYENEIQELKEQLDLMTRQRDNAITELVKLRNASESN